MEHSEQSVHLWPPGSLLVNNKCLCCEMRIKFGHLHQGMINLSLQNTCLNFNPQPYHTVNIQYGKNLNYLNIYSLDKKPPLLKSRGSGAAVMSNPKIINILRVQHWLMFLANIDLLVEKVMDIIHLLLHSRVTAVIISKGNQQIILS